MQWGSGFLIIGSRFGPDPNILPAPTANYFVYESKYNMRFDGYIIVCIYHALRGSIAFRNFFLTPDCQWINQSTKDLPDREVYL